MAYTTHTNAAGSSLLERIANFRAELSDRAAKRRVFRTTFAELEILTDRELADLGLTRSNIKAIAYEAAYGA